MIYSVEITSQAESDLRGIYEYIAYELQSPQTAAAQLSRLEENIFLIQMKNQIKNQETLQAEKLFERFYQGDASRSDTQSSGLGLAIVKRTVELHGGEITADVKEGWLVLEVRFWE